MNFNNLLGQEEIKKSLLHALDTDSCAHAYLFSGPEGIGKSSFSSDFANMLLCTGEGPHACGKCIACTTFNAGTNPDYLKIESDGNSISVDSIREIQSGAIIRPMYSKRKVYYIKQAEKMTQQAQNSLLKTLEESPTYCVIILSTHNPEMLIPTVRSRVLKYSFKKNSTKEVEEVLKGKNIENDNIRFITAFADGIPGLAVELASSEDFIKLREDTFDYLRSLIKRDIKAQFDFVKFLIKNSDEIDNILNILSCFYRDVLVAKKCLGLKVLINSDKEDMIREYGKKISSGSLCRIVEDIEDIRRNIKQNANIELAADVLVMKLQED